MRAAINRGIENEVVFVSGCKFTSPEELEKVIESYNRVYWRNHPTAGDATRKAFNEGRILCPRANGFCSPLGEPNDGERIYESFEEWRDAVASHAPKWNYGWCPRGCSVSRDEVMRCTTIEEVYSLFSEGS